MSEFSDYYEAYFVNVLSTGERTHKIEFTIFPNP